MTTNAEPLTEQHHAADQTDAGGGESAAESPYENPSQTLASQPAFKVRELYLSGGGLRATLCAIGCVGYLEARKLWDGVDEVVSVSGGSILNGALVADQLRSSEADEDLSGDDATVATLARTLTRLTSRSSHPLRSVGGIVLLFGLLLAVALVLVAGVLAARSERSAIAFAAGLALVPAVLYIVRRWVSMLLARAVRIGVGTDGYSRTTTCGKRDHVIVAASLTARSPRYFIWHRLETRSKWQTENMMPIDKAVRASCSFPFSAVERRSSVLHGSELLADAGWAGKFGEQWRAGTFEQSGFVIKRAFVALDAGTHAGVVSTPWRWLGRVSVISRLLQWLETSNEATYHNDLWDLQGGLVRVCVPRGDGSDKNVRKLNVLRERTAGISNLTRSHEDAACAVAAGFLSTLAVVESDVSLAEAPVLLRRFGEQLDSARSIEGSASVQWSELLTRVWKEAGE